MPVSAKKLAYAKERYWANRDQFLKRNKEYHSKNRAMLIAKYAAKRAKPEEKVAQRNRHLAWSNRNPERRLLYSAVSRARALGLECNITREDIIIPDFCPILGILLIRGSGKNGCLESSPSVDRIDIRKGYVKGNIAIISRRANRLKGDMTPEIIRKIILCLENTPPFLAYADCLTAWPKAESSPV